MFFLLIEIFEILVSWEFFGYPPQSYPPQDSMIVGHPQSARPTALLHGGSNPGSLESQEIFECVYMSNEENPGWLFHIKDEILPNYRDYNKP